MSGIENDYILSAGVGDMYMLFVDMGADVCRSVVDIYTFSAGQVTST